MTDQREDFHATYYGDPDEALKVAPTRLARIVDQLSEGIIVAEAPPGRVVFTNKQFHGIWKTSVGKKHQGLSL